MVEPGKAAGHEWLVRSTDLTDMKINHHGNGIDITGWAPASGSHSVTMEKTDCAVTKDWRDGEILQEIRLDGTWHFQLSPSSLDYTWAPGIDSDTVELPVMEFSPVEAEGKSTSTSLNPQSGDSRKRVKIEDAYNHKEGCQRYLSDWDAWWISYYEYGKHIAEIKGGTWYFRKSFNLPGRIKKATLEMTGDKAYELIRKRPANRK